jgi:hypothetical protein
MWVDPRRIAVEILTQGLYQPLKAGAGAPQTLQKVLTRRADDSSSTPKQVQFAARVCNRRFLVQRSAVDRGAKTSAARLISAPSLARALASEWSGGGLRKIEEHPGGD